MCIYTVNVSWCLHALCLNLGLQLAYNVHTCMYVFIDVHTLQLKASTVLYLEASYYNIGNDSWEPILEPIVDPQDESQYLSWGMKAKVVRQPPQHHMVQAGTYVQHHYGASRYVCTASLWCKQIRMYSIIMVQAGTYVQHHYGASRYVCTASLWCKQVRMYSIIMVLAGTYVQHHYGASRYVCTAS